MTGTFDFSVDDALALAYVSDPAWNDDGTRIGYRRFEGGETAFAVQSVGTIERTDLSLSNASEADIRFADADVSEFEWRPDHPTEVAIVADGNVSLFDVDTGETTTLSVDSGGHESLAFHPSGDRLAYLRDGTLCVHDLESGGVVAVEESVADLFGGTPLKWSPDGQYLATSTTTEDDVLGLTVVSAATIGRQEAVGQAAGEPRDVDEQNSVAWARRPDVTAELAVGSFDWVDDGHLVYAEDATDGSERVYRSVRIGDDDRGVPILSEADDRGVAHDEPVGTGHGRFAVLSARTGYHHVYAVDADERRDFCAQWSSAEGQTHREADSSTTDRSEADDSTTDQPMPGFDGPGVTQVTDGAFEARGDAVDTPAWNPAGDRLAYVTNAADPGERHLHVTQIGTDPTPTVEAQTVYDDVAGNVLYPTWADERLAVVRAGRTTPADVHVTDAESGAMQRISRSYPDADALASFPDPEPVSFEGVAETTVRGYCYAPPDAEPGDDRPAVVWCHGGPVRQMRRGFHHMRSYAFFHAFNHVLVSRGYVVLELNYRGGIGYGRDFEHGIYHAIGEDDVADCADAAAFLRDDDRVGEQVGLWGLSYGGFLANAVAAKTDAFDCAVNFAGIWDWRDWVRWVADKHRSAGRRFVAKFGGHPDDDDPTVAERYEVGSPCEFRADLDTPLFALHGTDDPNVPFDQMDDLVSDLVDDGHDFEMAYYPEEDHMFAQSSTWRDALDRVLPFLDDHLRD